MKKVLIATHNPAKFREMKRVLSDLKYIKIVFLRDLEITKDAPETGKTYEKISIQKAKFYAKLSNLPTIADDGGLEIDALGGAPGPKSRRWLGYKMTDQEIIDTILDKMKNVPKEKRSCRFRTVSTFIDPIAKNIKQSEGCLECVVASKAYPEIDKGYPFRSVLIDPKTKKYLIEYDKQDGFLSHRVKAMKKLKKYLKEKYLK